MLNKVMARFWLVRFVAFFHIFRLARHAMSAPIIESYKPSKSERLTPGIKEWDNLRKIAKTLEHKIDEAEVRQKFMQAQMQFPAMFMSRRFTRMLPAMPACSSYYGIPSNVYVNVTMSNKAGVLLQIFHDGTVNGTYDYESPYAKLTVEMMGSYRCIRIKGTLSQKYLMYKDTGRVAAELFQTKTKSKKLLGRPKGKRHIDASIFLLKEVENSRFVGLENIRHNWLLGFRHRGYNQRVLKKGPRVKLRHKESQFVIAQ